MEQKNPKLSSQERFENFKKMLNRKKGRGKRGQKKDEMEAILEVQQEIEIFS